MKKGLAIIGFGGMGHWHAENIKKRIEQIDVVGIYDVKKEVVEKAAADGYKTYSSPEELYADQNVDIVLVTTPNNFHAKYSKEAMRHGKNVVCEKPVCMNVEELDGVLAVARETGKLFTVHHNRRWDSDYAIMREILRSDTVGKPYFLDSRLYGSKGLPGDWRASKEAGGGMLYDWSVHLIDQVLTLIGQKPVSVYCDLQKVRFKEVDDCNRIVITFDGGARAQIVVDTWCYISEPRWHLSGEDGTATIYKWFGTEGKIVKANIKEINWEEGVIFTSNGRSSTMAPRPVEHLTELPLPTPPAPRWEEFYENVCAVIDGKAEPIVTHAQIRMNTLVVDSCFKSAETGTVVKL